MSLSEWTIVDKLSRFLVLFALAVVVVVLVLLIVVLSLIFLLSWSIYVELLIYWSGNLKIRLLLVVGLAITCLLVVLVVVGVFVVLILIDVGLILLLICFVVMVDNLGNGAVFENVTELSWIFLFIIIEFG